MPHQTKIRRGLERPDLFTVVAEHFRTDTVEYADIVLPATMQLEHADLQIAYGHLYISWNEPAVPPPGECLSSTEMFRRLARRLGLDVPCLYDSDEEMARQILDSDHPSLRGITLDELKARGWMRLNYPEPFVPFAAGFPTPSGRLEFFSERMTQAGLDPLAGYTPPYEAAQQGTPLAERYPLALIAGANHYFLNSLFANVARPEEAIGPAGGPDPPRRRGGARARDGARGAGLQRPRRVRRPCRGHRRASAGAWSPAPRASGPASCRGARPSTPPWTSGTPTWAAAPSSTTTASRSSDSRPTAAACPASRSESSWRCRRS